jgi:membrane carboxypeptidase/penicillin-binding protein
MAFVLGLGGVAGGVGTFVYFGKDLPDHEALGLYDPPTVTVVHDAKGRLLGEIFEKRRYVIPLSEVPQHVIDAFIAAEDASFWTHSGIDPMGIFRAVVRNLAKGKKAQGASTITQQVARNFLLTREKTFTRKIKEMILAQRVEEVFEKEHILYLYLNQTYLGSGAYGVEAAARIYFGKHIGEVNLAEAAILAGLPQRPSDYSPHRHWKKSRARQIYVLDQMLAKGYIDQAIHDATLAQPVNISPKTNDFLTKAPHFTEHIRRYLVDTYGFDKIYNDGLSVDATCDLDLQRAAQDALENGVGRADRSRGWRGANAHLEGEAINAKRAEVEEALRKVQSKARLWVGDTDESADNAGGYGPMPDKATLEVDVQLDGVILQVAKDHMVLGVGASEVVVPLAWTKWAYPINVKRSYKHRAQNNLRNAFVVGDVLEVRIVATSAADESTTRQWATGADGARAAARVVQDPLLQGALLSYRLDTGAVQAMVGGVDFEHSEYNRATQSRRQVGSTFKPIVYAAAIGTRLFTVASMLQDAPTIIGEAGGTMWKPSNYGSKYLGNITLRKALQMSRNVCTVRVIDAIGADAVYQLAGPSLGIGFPEPKCSRTHIPLDTPCVGERSDSTIAGMSWCEHCDPTSCPVARVDSAFTGECMDEPWDDKLGKWCHSCDLNLRACDWWPHKNMGPTAVCPGARRESEDTVMCRACDLSMGLGSSSLTMVELSRAYSAFATYGHLVEPYWIERVIDRDGTVIESHEAPNEWPLVLDPGTASIAHYLLRAVATGGTGAKSNRLGFQVAGKTGTTNDFKDAWFMGYNPDFVTSVWVGFDQPANMGQSFTGGDTALPIWMEYMAEAVDKDTAPIFPPLPGVAFAPIDEQTGLIAQGGRSMPFLPGTLPNNEMGVVGQISAQDLMTEDF